MASFEISIIPPSLIESADPEPIHSEIEADDQKAANVVSCFLKWVYQGVEEVDIDEMTDQEKLDEFILQVMKWAQKKAYQHANESIRDSHNSAIEAETAALNVAWEM